MLTVLRAHVLSADLRGLEGIWRGKRPMTRHRVDANTWVMDIAEEDDWDSHISSIEEFLRLNSAEITQTVAIAERVEVDLGLKYGLDGLPPYACWRFDPVLLASISELGVSLMVTVYLPYVPPPT